MLTIRTHRYSLFLAVLMIISVAYGNSLFASFQFDDFNVIMAADAVQSWASWWADVGHGIRPLLKFTYTLNGWLDKAAWGFRLFNWAVHLANTLLIFHLAKRAVLHCDARAQAVAVAALCALLFAVHPAQTEAVTYITGRSSSLMTLFYLLAVASYERGLQSQRAGYFYLATPLFFGLALATKETAITLPIALYLWHRCFYAQHTQRVIALNLAAVIFVWLCASVMFLWQARYAHSLMLSVGLHSVSVNFFTQIHGIVYLLGQWLWPVQMNIDPDLPVYHSMVQIWREALFIMVVVSIALWQKNRLVCFALGWWWLQLLPLYVFFPRADGVNDRQLYLAAWPWLLCLSYALLSEISVRKIFVGLSLVSLLTQLTWQRNQAYRDEISLWQATVLASPNKARAYNNLGYAYFLSGREREAQLAYQAALILDKNYPQAEKNLLLLEQSRQ